MRRNPFTGLIAAALVVFTTAACTESEPPKVVDPATTRAAPAGTFVGMHDVLGNHQWLGIHYAEAPTGAMRWKAPVAARPREGTTEAIRNGAVCPQFASRFGGERGDPRGVRGEEDCLTLDIYAPADLAPGEKLPVMVWIHGGGNTIGSSGFYQGAELTREGRVVVVAIQYRLGPLGFFRHASLRAGTDDIEGSGNFALLDMAESLRWVKKNISVFGGDPENVTIFGESAGGRNVFSLLLMPQAAGLFHRAIAQSGSLVASTRAEAENAVDAAEPGHPASSNESLFQLLVLDGTAKDRDTAKAAAAKMSATQVAAYLRGKSTQEFFLAYADAEGVGMADMPRTVRDGTVLPEKNPIDSFSDGEFNRVPVIAGTNRDEFKLFLAADPELVWQLFGILPRIRDTERYNTIAEHASKSWKAIGADEPAAAMRRSGHGQVWVYRFDWDEEGSFLGTDFSELLGAGHALEIPFVFGHYDLGPELNRIFNDENAAGRAEVQNAMISYWSEFARKGNPGRGGKTALPVWQNGPDFLVIDTSDGGGLRHSDQTLTEESVLAAIQADPRLDATERCVTLKETVRGQVRHSEADLARYGC
jgi:para-nitrobenzyl esterase